MKVYGKFEKCVVSLWYWISRSMEGLYTTRGSNSLTKAKMDWRNCVKEKYLNGTPIKLEYIEAITITIGRGDLETGSKSLQTSNIMRDSLNLSTDDEDKNSEKCHVCLLPRIENFALLHENFLHGGFCKTCGNRLLAVKADCPISRSKYYPSLRFLNNWRFQVHFHHSSCSQYSHYLLCYKIIRYFSH